MYGLPKVLASENAYSLDRSVDTPLPLSRCKMTDDESIFTSEMADYFLWMQSYGPNNPHHKEHEYNLVMMMAHEYMSPSMVVGD